DRTHGACVSQLLHHIHPFLAGEKDAGVLEQLSCTVVEGVVWRKQLRCSQEIFRSTFSAIETRKIR
ncbi:MAG: hypothetical protein WDA72_06325, partial [Desulfomonilia bacterium]